MQDRARLADTLLKLHGAERILVLPNAWDVASARVLAAAGARAVGTTSMGIAASLGFPDGEVLPLDLMLDAVGRIVAAVDLPVTADMEAGYGDTTDEVVASVRRAIECGVVGINIEDTTGDPERPLHEAEVLAERVTAIREVAAAAGLHLVVNARTDVFLTPIAEPAAALSDAVARLNRYREAGADCAFAPGRLDEATIRALVAGVDAPLNVLANPALMGAGAHTPAALEAMGVARVSVGSGLMRAALAWIGRAAEDLLRDGSYAAMEHEVARDGAADTYRAAIGESPGRNDG